MDSSRFSQENRTDKPTNNEVFQKENSQYYPSFNPTDNQNRFAYPTNLNTNNPNYLNSINTNNNQFNNNPQDQYPQQNPTNIPYQNYVNPQQLPYNQSNNNGNQNLKPKIIIPQNSIVRKYSISQVSNAIQRNRTELPQDFRKKWSQLQYFGDVTRNVTAGSIFLSFAYVFFNSKKKWFKLTANIKLLAFNVGYMTFSLVLSRFFVLGDTTNLIAQNLMTVESLMIKEQERKKSSFIN